MAIVYITGSAELLDRVGPLWEKLNAHHAEHSLYFAAEHLRITYAERKAYFQTLAQSAELRVDLLNGLNGFQRIFGLPFAIF